MTPECKRIKITCLAALAVGLVEVILGFVLTPPFGASIYVMFTPIVSGVIALVLGVHGSRAANVPAKAAKLTPFALVVVVLGIVCGAFALHFGHGFTYISAITVIPAVLALLVAIFSRQVQAALDRA